MTHPRAYDYLIVGAGFSGAVCAQVLAEQGKRVLLIDRRPHAGGNAHDTLDEHGVRIHPYGPHIFHTQSKKVFEYLSRFTHWRFYEHRVLAEVNGVQYPIPINRSTINRLYGLKLDQEGVAAFLDHVRSPRDQLLTSEDVVLSSVGPDLCDKFFRGYTRKQWGLDLSELAAGVAARIPTRSNDDDRYFSDSFQFMPAEGYDALFQRLIDSPHIELQLNTSFDDVRQHVHHGHLIYTGPIDAYFGYCHGPLAYRSLRFEHEHLPQDLSQDTPYQSVGTVNYPNDHAYTRITEFKHLTGQACAGTSIVREYPQAEGEPYYPVPRPENEARFKQYQALAEQEQGVSFVGRLAQYRYYNMDQVVAAALSTAAGLLG